MEKAAEAGIELDDFAAARFEITGVVLLPSISDNEVESVNMTLTDHPVRK